jgi:hypothetical protein
MGMVLGDSLFSKIFYLRNDEKLSEQWGPPYSSRSARDRDRLRQEVLEGLGWVGICIEFGLQIGLKIQGERQKN